MAEAGRGIAVVDVGATNTKVALFDAAGRFVDARKRPSAHLAAPPYTAIDAEPLMAFVPLALQELDRVLPIDWIVPSAHGSALVLVDAAGGLAMPIMDYTATPPAAVRAAYGAISPRFAEVFCPVAPLALCLGLQLYWQETAFPQEFGRAAAILPWAQYVAFRLGGRPTCEVTTLGAQAQLWDVAGNRFSSIVRARGWERRLAPLAKAWQEIGTLPRPMRGDGFRGHGRVLAGIHDSNANYLRYLAAGLSDFTLLSTGTWIIGFAPGASIHALDPDRDTCTNTDILGRPVACCRFMGGREFEVLAAGAPAEAASIEAAACLVAAGTLALPSFTASGGPMPGTGGMGRIDGPAPRDDAERASLASLYCALMSAESLAAVGATGDIVVDGPFARNPVYLSALAALQPGRRVLASDLKDGTTAGAALLGLMADNGGRIPEVALSLAASPPLAAPGFAAYAARWRQLTGR